MIHSQAASSPFLMPSHSSIQKVEKFSHHAANTSLSHSQPALNAATISSQYLITRTIIAINAAMAATINAIGPAATPPMTAPTTFIAAIILATIGAITPIAVIMFPITTSTGPTAAAKAPTTTIALCTPGLSCANQSTTLCTMATKPSKAGSITSYICRANPSRADFNSVNRPARLSCISAAIRSASPVLLLMAPDRLLKSSSAAFTIAKSPLMPCCPAIWAA